MRLSHDFCSETLAGEPDNVQSMPLQQLVLLIDWFINSTNASLMTGSLAIRQTGTVALASWWWDCWLCLYSGAVRGLVVNCWCYRHPTGKVNCRTHWLLQDYSGEKTRGRKKETPRIERNVRLVSAERQRPTNNVFVTAHHHSLLCGALLCLSHAGTLSKWLKLRSRGLE